MNNLERAKAVIKEHIKEAECGIFDIQNWCGDPMVNIFDEDGLRIDICYGYEYFEVFGLSREDFAELVNYYNQLRGWR